MADDSNKHARARGKPVYDIDEKGSITGRTKGAAGRYVGGYDPEQKSLTQISRETDRALGRKDSLPLRPGQDRYPDDDISIVLQYNSNTWADRTEVEAVLVDIRAAVTASR